MPIVPIQPAGSLGIIKDVKPHELPPQAWSDGMNVRFIDGYVQRSPGETSVMPTVATPPMWLLPWYEGTIAWWLYAGTAAVYATDGTNHYDLSGATYNATLDLNWTGGMFNSVPVVNNPVDGPFYLPGPTPSTSNLTALPNWTYGTVTSMRCAALRPFKNFLVAMNVTKTVGGVDTNYPQMVKWSHVADPGAMSISWDEADTRYDTGETVLTDSDGIIMDSLPLRDLNVIYKEDSVYLMQFIGGVFVFKFQRAFTTFGMLAPNCAAPTPHGEQVVLASDDVVLHNGFNARSLMDRRMRKNLFNKIDPATYNRSFAVWNNAAREVWICIPESGATLPSLAYIWNWRDDTWTNRELNSPAYMTQGVASLGGIDPWDSATGPWDTESTHWDFRTFNPSVPYLLGAHYAAQKLLLYDVGSDFDTVAYTSTLERTGLGVPFDAGQPPDIHSVKFLRGVWPRIEGPAGNVVSVELGAQYDLSTPVVWDPPQNFTIGSQQKLDCRISGRLLAIRVTCPGGYDWRLHGYDLDVVRGGTF